MSRPPIPMQELLAASGGRIVGDLDPSTVFGWIERNSREITPGDIFIAVQGERFDGHQFVADAANRGAAAALVSEAWAAGQPEPPLPLVLVEDPVTALQQLAAARRLTMPDLRVIGITGSIGKTSTKEVVAAVLRQRFRTYRSPGNMNSEIGCPLSILEVEPGTEVAVLEMGGAYAFGELALLARIARPSVGIVTNVHPVHLERMGTIEAIAQTKAELPASIPTDGVVILNGDDFRVDAMADVTSARVVRVGREPGNDIRATDAATHGFDGISFTLHVGGRSWPLELPLVGMHSVELALVGVAAGLAFGMTVEEIIPAFHEESIQVRLVPMPGPRGSRLIDDTYNASAPSVLSALRLLGESHATRTVAVLGDMRELGAESDVQHREVGRAAAKVADVIATYGALATTIAEEARASAAVDGRLPIVTEWQEAGRDDLVHYLLDIIAPGDTVLLKGSRGLEMENIVAALRAAADDRTGA